MKQKTFKEKYLAIIVLFLIVPMLFSGRKAASAATIQPSAGSVDINQAPGSKLGQGFMLVACDGAAGDPTGSTTVPCDFIGLMKTIQHLIDVAMVVGVIAAIIGLLWAGALYMTGQQSKISDAKKMLPKLFWGFVIMMTAWFIVYQILSWLTDNAAYKALLGN